MYPQTQHKQKLVRVNARVDEGVAHLVESLSRLKDLVTFESCENVGEGWACVWFQWGPTVANMAQNCHELVREFAKVGFDFKLSIEWTGGKHEYPHAVLALPLEVADDASIAITEWLTRQSRGQLPTR